MSSVDIISLKKDIEFIKETLTDIKSNLSNIRNNYITKEQTAASIHDIDDKIEAIREGFGERLKRLEFIIYSMIGLILTGFIGALIALVFKK